MPKDIQPILRQIGQATQNIQPAQTQALGRAVAGAGEAAQGLLAPLVEEQSARAGERAVEAGTAPKQLAPGIGRATRAFNDAVSNTEGRKLITAGREEIMKALAEESDPANFNNLSPAKLDAKLKGIREGVSEQSRDSNRAQVMANLDEVSGRAKVAMFNQAIQYDNAVMQNSMKSELENLTLAKREAFITGNTEDVALFDKQIKEVYENYSTMNESIAISIPKLKQEQEKADKINEQIGGFVRAANDGTQNEFMLKLLTEKPENLTFDEWQEAAKEIAQIHNLQQRLINEARGEEVAIVNRGILTGEINDPDKILENPVLTVPQKLSAVNQLEKLQQEKAKKEFNTLRAQRDILMGRGAGLANSQIEGMYQEALLKSELVLGRPLTLGEMSDSIMGVGEVNAASGMVGIPLGTSVGTFNSIMGAQLTSRDPRAQAEAIFVWNKMVNTLNSPNSVEISGDALSVATLGSTLTLGNTVSFDEAANLATKAVMDKTEAEVEQRKARFNKDISPTLAKKFKDVFDTKVKGFETDAAFGTFKKTYQAHYLASASEKAALKAARYAMADWGTDPRGPDGFVMQSPPSKELAIAQMGGNAWNNQIAIGMQQIIDKNKETRAAGFSSVVVEWADSSHTIDIASLTDEQKVLEPLQTKTGLFGGLKPINAKIKVDGQESEVFLLTGPDVRLGDDGKFIYTYFYKDRFGNLQNLPDLSNTPKGIAQLQAQELDEYAPEVFNEKNNAALVKLVQRAQDNQLKGMINTAKKDSTMLKLLSTDALAAVISQLTNESPDGNPDARKMLEQLKKRQKGESLEEEVEADG